MKWIVKGKKKKSRNPSRSRILSGCRTAGNAALVGELLGLKYVLNPGAAFGMLANHRWVFIIISTVAILALGAYLFMGKAQNKLYSTSIALIVSGGIGNMIDRIFLGKVVDFIDFILVPAVFNVADTFICVGAALLILALIIDIVKEYKNEKKKKEERLNKESEEND